MNITKFIFLQVMQRKINNKRKKSSEIEQVKTYTNRQF